MLDAARAAEIPVLAHISTLAEVRDLVDHGAAGFIGMIADTEDLDPAFLAHLARPAGPVRTRAGDRRRGARRRRSEIPGGCFRRACRSPRRRRAAICSARSSCWWKPACRRSTRSSPRPGTARCWPGTRIAERSRPDKRADLLVLSANPGEDIRNLRKVALRLNARGVGEVALLADNDAHRSGLDIEPVDAMA